MKLIKCIIPILAVTATVGLANPSYAATLAAVPPAEKPDTPEKAEPFRGKVDAVDSTAQTLTVDGKLIYITANTKLTKAGKAITLADITAGDQVHGLARKTSDGKMEASTVVVGPSVAKMM